MVHGMQHVKSNQDSEMMLFTRNAQCHRSQQQIMLFIAHAPERGHVTVSQRLRMLRDGFRLPLQNDERLSPSGPMV